MAASTQIIQRKEQREKMISLIKKGEITVIRNNTLTRNDYLTIFKLLKNNSCHNVKKLAVMECGFMEHDQDGNNVDDYSFLELAAMLKEDCKLEVLEFPELSTVTEYGFTEVLKALTNHPRLIKLDLFDCPIGHFTCLELIKLLRSNQTIHTLNLSNNKFLEEDLIILFDTMTKRELGLNSLTFQSSHFKEKAFDGLASLIESPKGPRYLSLSGCRLTDQQLRRLMTALKVTDQLLNLELSYIKMSDSILIELSQSLMINTSLQTIHPAYYFDIKPLSSEVIEAFQSLKKERPDLVIEGFDNLKSSSKEESLV